MSTPSNVPALTFVPLDVAGLALYARWFDDAETRRRYEPPTQRWFDFVQTTPGNYAWLVYTSDEAVGSVHLELAEQQIAYVGLVVRPDVRGRGYGRAILRALVARSELADVRVIEAGIAADNEASRRCFAAAGFVASRDAPDVDGFMKYVYRLSK